MPHDNEDLEFFADRDLGKAFVERIRAEGLCRITGYSERFGETSAEDDRWIAQTADHGMVALSHDSAIRRSPLARRAVYVHRCRLFILRGQVSTTLLAEFFLCAFDKVVRFASEQQPPFIAVIVRRQRLGKTVVNVEMVKSAEQLSDEFGNEGGSAPVADVKHTPTLQSGRAGRSTARRRRLPARPRQSSDS